MKSTFAALLCLALAGALSACHKQEAQEQDLQISPAVRAAVTAALGPHVSDADVTEFLRSAKLASRTKHDAEVVAMLDEVVSLGNSAAQDDYQAEEHRRESRKYASMLPEDHMDCSGLSDVSDCEQINNANQQLNKLHQEKARQSEELVQSHENGSKLKRAEIAELVQKLQAALH